ncbi:hypothetical protein [Mycobacterium uberis]|uniref:hypothetical protein n=1 Tax=Mycobacterium uberis TaxID=2162698 RepID=UPI000E30680E|nr:hypothetical protein [Mycobacterium uberis]
MQLTPIPSPAHHSLSQVLLAWTNNKSAEWALRDLNITIVPLQTHAARMNIVPLLYENVFDATTISASIDRLEKLLLAITADLHRRLSSIDLT